MTKRLHLLLLLALLCYRQSQSQIIDTLVKVDGHQLHFEIVKGQGIPILFESGNGDDATVWKPILEILSKNTSATLITYDRAGLGKSEVDTTKISFKREVENLEIALKKLGYGKELFLVAHSFGGFYASYLSYRNPSMVKGAVYIDVATPCHTTKQWAENYRESISAKNWKLIKEYKSGLYHVLKNFPEIAEFMSTRYISSQIPLTLIVAQNLPNENTLKTDEDRKNWVKCLKEFGNLPNHKYTLAKNADHHVWREAPEIVIQEITELYKKTSGNQ